MKKFIFIVFIAFLTSCTVTTVTKEFYQIGAISSDLPTANNGGYKYVDDVCEILYDFWADGGAVKFSVFNKTDEIMYIDMSQSYLIKNGIAHDYFRNSVSEIASLGGSVSFAEKMIVGIPPKSAKVFNEFSIMENRFESCDLYESPSMGEEETCPFTMDNTPMYFTNYISYALGEKSAHAVIKNSFYVCEVKNQHHDMVVGLREIGCPTDMYKTNKYVFIQSSPKSFYIKYTPREQKRRMEQPDAKASESKVVVRKVKKTKPVNRINPNQLRRKLEYEVEHGSDWEYDHYESE